MRLTEDDINIRCAIVVFDSDGMVLIEHPLGRKKAPGNWDLPKGHVDLDIDKDFKDAALRECKEETGLVFSRNDISEVAVVSYYNDELHVFALNKPFDFSIDDLNCRSTIGPDCAQKWKIGLPEVDDYYSVSFDELTDWLFAGYNKAKFISPVAEWIDSRID